MDDGQVEGNGVEGTRGHLFVLDGTAALFRTYFAGESIEGSQGVEVGGVVGFCRYLSRCVRVLSPQYMAVVFDAGAKTFRHDRYPDYKANRPKLPEDLTPQFDLAHEAAGAMGFATFRLRGYEADDLMATLAARATKASLRSWLISSDKDILQLIDDAVRVVDPRDLTEVGAPWVRSRFGVTPRKLGDFLALAGDSSDNVPGVKGVGPKAAAILLTAFDGLDGIYDNLDVVDTLPIRGAVAVRRRLEAGRDDAYLSRELVELKCDVPLGADLTLGDLRYRGPAPDARFRFHEIGVPTPALPATVGAAG